MAGACLMGPVNLSPDILIALIGGLLATTKCHCAYRRMAHLCLARDWALYWKGGRCIIALVGGRGTAGLVFLTIRSTHVWALLLVLHLVTVIQFVSERGYYAHWLHLFLAATNKADGIKQKAMFAPQSLEIVQGKPRYCCSLPMTIS